MTKLTILLVKLTEFENETNLTHMKEVEGHLSEQIT